MLNQSGRIILVLMVLLVFGMVGMFLLPKFRQKNEEQIPSNSLKKADQLVSYTPTTKPIDLEKGNNGQNVYRNSEFGFVLSFPSSWRVEENSDAMKYGDLFSIYTTGESQKEGTEFNDGASFTVGVPQRTAKDVNSFAKDYHGSTNSHGADNDFSKASFGGKDFQKVVICEYGCFTFYHIKNGDYIYTISTFVKGSSKEVNEKNIEKVLSSFEFEQN